MTGGGENFVLGNGDYSDTIKLDTPLASEITSGAVFSRFHGKTYTPYSCDVKLPFIPCATSIITIDGEELFTNRVVCYPRGSGIYAKVSCNADTSDEWDYSGEIERAILDKIAVGEPIGKLTILRDGHLKFENDGEEYPMTSYVYTTENGLLVDSQRAAFKAEVLNLEDVPEIKLNSDELLTESKELVGALNELFLAAPEGGDSGAQGFSDIAPFLTGYNVWYTAFNLSAINPQKKPCVGYRFPNKYIASQMSHDIEVFTFNPTAGDYDRYDCTVHVPIKIYGYNVGDGTATLLLDTNHTQTFGNRFFNKKDLVTAYITFTNSTAYEYYLVIYGGTTIDTYKTAYIYDILNPLTSSISFLYIPQGVTTPSDNAIFRYDRHSVFFTNSLAVAFSGYYGAGAGWGFSYGSADIDAAIKAFNSGS
jgi:hypothetical protein